MSTFKRSLLDKNVARNLLEGLEALLEGRVPADDERLALNLLTPQALEVRRLFVVPATANVLQRHFRGRVEVVVFQQYAEIITPTRYFKHWARRLREIGFTREDANVLSMATFGTDERQSFLGLDQVLTFDKALVNLFDEKNLFILRRLSAMKQELSAPYAWARLPQVCLLKEPD